MGPLYGVLAMFSFHFSLCRSRMLSVHVNMGRMVVCIVNVVRDCIQC